MISILVGISGIQKDVAFIYVFGIMTIVAIYSAMSGL